VSFYRDADWYDRMTDELAVAVDRDGMPLYHRLPRDVTAAYEQLPIVARDRAAVHGAGGGSPSSPSAAVPFVDESRPGCGPGGS
jgi:hypothetical protein